MKLLAKAAVVALLGGVGASLYAAPDPNAASAQLSSTEMLREVKATQQQIVSDVRHVFYLQQLARKAKDVIKLNCVNDKLVQLKAHANIADRVRPEIESATDAGAVTRQVAEHRQAGENVRRLREEADQCIGEPALGTESSSEWTVPDVPDNPFTEPFGTLVEPPGYASPFS